MILLALMALVSKVFVNVTILKIAGMVQMKSIAVSKRYTKTNYVLVVQLRTFSP